MQLFNGITLGNFKMFMVRFDDPNPESPSRVVDTKSKEYDQILAQINEIKDGNKNTNDNIEGLNGLLSSEFAARLSMAGAKNLLVAIYERFNNGVENSNFDDIIKADPSVFESIKNANSNVVGLADLIDFLEPIADPLSVHKAANLDDSDSVVSKSKTLNESMISGLNTSINSYIEQIDENLDLRLKEVKKSLENIRTVLDKPTVKYVKQLQDFIWKYFDDNENSRTKRIGNKDYDKEAFCDGTLGNDTLAGLEEVLKKIKKYVDDVKEAIAVEKKADEAKKKSDGSKKVDNKGENAPVAPAPKPMESQILKTGGFNKADKQVAFGSTVVALYSCESSAGSSGSNAEGNDVDNRLDGAKIDTAQETLRGLKYELGGEQLYLMQTGNNVYMVRLDKNNCLYPFAVNLARPDKPVLLENNPSCMQYLKNKVPDSISNDVTIGWKDRNYVIGKRGYDKWLTIEPMTIAGEWVSRDLSECLAFLNFTNYLRNEPGLDRDSSNGRLDGKFKNDNPDIELDDNGVYVKVKKMDKNDYKDKSDWDNGYDRSRDYMNVNLGRFGLPDVLSPAWSEFKKYNNGEHREDNWDKRQKGKYGRASMQEDIYNAEIAARRKESGGNVLGGGGGGGSFEALNTTPVALQTVDANFNRGNYGIPQNCDVYRGEFHNVESYYYQNRESIVKISESSPWLKETVLGNIDSNNLKNFTMPSGAEKDVNLCDEGVNMLCAKLDGVYAKIMNDNGAVLTNISFVSERSGYSLKKVGDLRWNFPLDKDFFTGAADGKYLGFQNFEDRLKIALFACLNYGDIFSGNVISLKGDDAEKYGINEDNLGDINKWLGKQVKGGDSVSRVEISNSGSSQ